VAAFAPAQPIEKRWIFARPDPDAVDRLAREANLPAHIARVLVARGIADPDTAARFLEPRLRDLTPPDQMKDLARAAERVARAVMTGEPIAVYGDFDVDGVTSVSLLHAFFKDLGTEVRTYIPLRMGEGYGLNEEAVATLAGEGVRVLITVDCGISDVAPIERAAALGLDVIVTDHHRVTHGLPPAFAVVDPNRPDCEFPFKHLAGVGLAFYLAAATRRKLEEAGWAEKGPLPDLRRVIDLVALGTVADIAELSGENRILTRFGLAMLTEETRVGIRALKETAGIARREVTAGTVGYQLGPRINAAGRLGDATLGLTLLTTDSVSVAVRCAHQLEEANRKRQGLEQEILEDARRRIAASPEMAGRSSIVLSSERWHPGVVGIVASKLVEEFNKPTILLAEGPHHARGSARSVSGYNIHEGIGACQELLVTFGGHRMAAGLELERGRIGAFTAAFEAVTAKALDGVDRRPSLHLDMELGFAEVNEEFINELSRLAPFGFGNPEPVVATRGARIAKKQVVGTRHLKCLIEHEGFQHEAIWFGRGHALNAIPEVVDVAYQAHLDTYLGVSRVVLHIKDLRPAE
jgi:single-stranded-DNA-specific exonuclease